MTTAFPLRNVTKLLQNEDADWIKIARAIILHALRTSARTKEVKSWGISEVLLGLNSFQTRISPTLDKMLKAWYTVKKKLRWSGAGSHPRSATPKFILAVLTMAPGIDSEDILKLPRIFRMAKIRNTSEFWDVPGASLETYLRGSHFHFTDADPHSIHKFDDCFQPSRDPEGPTTWEKAMGWAWDNLAPLDDNSWNLPTTIWRNFLRPTLLTCATLVTGGEFRMIQTDGDSAGGNSGVVPRIPRLRSGSGDLYVWVTSRTRNQNGGEKRRVSNLGHDDLLPTIDIALQQHKQHTACLILLLNTLRFNWKERNECQFEGRHTFKGINLIIDESKLEIEAKEFGHLTEKQRERQQRERQLIQYWQIQSVRWHNGETTKEPMPPFQAETANDSGPLSRDLPPSDQTDSQDLGTPPWGLDAMLHFDRNIDEHNAPVGTATNRGHNGQGTRRPTEPHPPFDEEQRRRLREYISDLLGVCPVEVARDSDQQLEFESYIKDIYITTQA
ncbi:hypothetical protein R1sor_008333 [Riccia sorocarpa]|uniref:Uncharacterized protein n=1 Tax=Riccia sorocarpa TaxID=122646 RepID=A0ABD3HT35_9MARC